jgi:hypothetical protein
MWPRGTWFRRSWKAGFVVTMDQSVGANPDGSLTYAGEGWVAAEPLRFRNVSDGRFLTFQEDSSGPIRFLNCDSERIAWYQSGRAAISLYFCFVLISAAILWRKPLAFRADAGDYWNLNRYSTGSNELRGSVVSIPNVEDRKSTPRPTSTRSVCRASGFVQTAKCLSTKH